MGKFNEISRGHIPKALQGTRSLMGNNKVRIIYNLSNSPKGAEGAVGAVVPGKARSKTIALNVVGKPNKVRVYKNRIKAVLTDNGASLLFLINKKNPIILRDSAQEVENKIRWANGY